MFELVHEYPDIVTAAGVDYRARAYGERQSGGGWGGFLVFVPLAGGRVVSTERETTQSTLDALAHWAGTLSWVYLEGALTRALEHQPEVQLSRRVADIEHAEAAARAEAEALEHAAEQAREEAEIARREREAAERLLVKTAAESAEEAAAFHESAAERERALAAALERKPRVRKSAGRAAGARKRRS